MAYVGKTEGRYLATEEYILLQSSAGGQVVIMGRHPGDPNRLRWDVMDWQPTWDAALEAYSLKP